MSNQGTQTGKINEKELRLWDRLELLFEERDQQGEYITRIEDLSDMGAVVARPEWISGEPLLKDGTICSVTFVRPSCAYGFNAKIKRFQRKDAKEYWLLDLPKDVNRIQRRRYVRVDVTLPFRFKVLEDIKSTKDFDDIEWEEGKTRNLSAGGIGFEWEEKLSKEDSIAVALELPERDKTIRTIARVARIIEEEEGKFLIGLELLHSADIGSAFRGLKLDAIPKMYRRFSDRDRNELANFVFAEEVAIRRRNLV